MKSFYERTIAEQELIHKVYQFEADMIAEDDLDKMSTPNPYMAELKALPDGAELMEAIEEALEMAFRG